jgi:hypothetical protein
MLLIPGAAILCASCYKHVHVTKEMAWECLPGETDPEYPDAEPVIFRYPEDPGFFDMASGRTLCQQLQASGWTTAQVTYDVWGSSFRGLNGYRIELVNGQRLQDIGSPTRSGYHGKGNSGPPLMKALE